jgi:acyl dehydratase
MPIHYDRLMALDIPVVEHTYTTKDTILYALGVGLGHDPLDEKQLAFVTEKDLRALPTLVTVLGHSAFWIRDLDTGIDYLRLVHGEESIRLHRPLPAAGTVIGKTRVLDIVDKGPGKGAVLYAERTVTDKASGELLASVVHTVFCRGDGGFGGPAQTTVAAVPHALPQRTPDLVCDLSTRPETALIYRLSGDLNPLHSDPATAKAAGFPRPILHGLASFGVVGHALLKTVCDYDPARLSAMEGRFSAPILPGETIRTEMWRDGNVVSFRARVVERDVIAISNGRAEIAG